MTTQTAESSANYSDRLVSIVLIAQLILTFLVTIIFWVFSGNVSGYSALLGGISAVVPNSFLAFRLSLYGSDKNTLLETAFFGEVGKFFLTLIMLSLIFLFVHPLYPGAFFVGFIGGLLAVLSGIVSPYIFKNEGVNC